MHTSRGPQALTKRTESDTDEDSENSKPGPVEGADSQAVSPLDSKKDTITRANAFVELEKPRRLLSVLGLNRNYAKELIKMFKLQKDQNLPKVYIRQTLVALAHIHGAGIAHGDLRTSCSPASNECGNTANLMPRRGGGRCGPCTHDSLRRLHGVRHSSQTKPIRRLTTTSSQ